MDDHFVSQTYLHGFTNAQGLLIPYKKRAQKVIGKPRSPASICYEVDGDSNPYFKDPRILDKILPKFEQLWASNVSRIEQGEMDPDLKWSIAGYLAFLKACNPLSIRLGQKKIERTKRPPEDLVVMSAISQSKNVELSMKARLLSKFDVKGKKPEVDKKYVHALGIKSLEAIHRRFFESPWDVLLNDADVPFVTSDSPTVTLPPERTKIVLDDGRELFLERPGNTLIYIPLLPSCAVVVNFSSHGKGKNVSKNWSYDPKEDHTGTVKKASVQNFNELIVKCAERYVLHSSRETWLHDLVSKFSRWRLEFIEQHLGPITVTRMQPMESKSPV